MLIMIILLLIGVVFARAIRDAVVLHFPASKFMFDFFTAARRFFVPAVLTLIFTALYTYLPNVKNKFHWELPGALFTAVAWYFVSWVFSIFVNTVTFANTYGSLSTVVVAMLWMYCIFYLILFGATLNRFFRELFLTFGQLRKQRKEALSKS